MNVLRPHLRTTIETLLEGGASHREIQRRTGVDRKTIRRYARSANSPTPATGSEPRVEQTPPPRPPGPASADSLEPAPAAAPAAAQAANTVPARAESVSACAVHREWIETQVQRGRNAMSIYQDLVDEQGFTHRYNSVKRFVARLWARAPERFDVLEFPPGEEAQVDFGLGAPTLHKGGRCKRRFCSS